jgi:hypothetical protein
MFLKDSQVIIVCCKMLFEHFRENKCEGLKVGVCSFKEWEETGVE